MALKWTNRSDLDRQFALAKREYERKAVMWLASLGERVVTHARENGSYADRTANLRNSIGYIIVQNGKIMMEVFKGSSPSRTAGGNVSEAHQRGLEHAKKVAQDLNPGKTYLIWVAGMKYARYVEAKGFDVLQGSGNWVEANAQMLIKEFERYLTTA